MEKLDSCLEKTTYDVSQREIVKETQSRAGPLVKLYVDGQNRAGEYGIVKLTKSV